MTPEQQFLDFKVQQAMLRDRHGVKTAGAVSEVARRLFNMGKRGSIGTLLGGLGGAGLSLATGGGPLMMIGGGAALGGIGGLTRGLLQRSLSGTPVQAAVNIAENPMLLKELQGGLSSPFAQKVKGFAEGFEPALPLVLGGAGGYMLADDDSKLLGASLGAGAGFMARPFLGRLKSLRG